jgi:small subunit ribosomal protein S4
VKPGDVVTAAPREKVRTFLTKVVEASKGYQQVPGWLERDESNLSIKVLNLPTREEFPYQIREQLIVEGLSK